MTFSYEIKVLMNYKKRPKVRKINAIGQTLSFTWSVSEVWFQMIFSSQFQMILSQLVGDFTQLFTQLHHQKRALMSTHQMID